MRAEVKRSIIRGKVRAPTSKSFGIRLILYSLLANVRLLNVSDPSDDIQVARNFVKELGVIEEKPFAFNKVERLRSPSSLYFGGSATTLRMGIPILAVLGGRVMLDGDSSLRRRPLNAIIDALKPQVSFSSTTLPTIMEGRLKTDHITISGSESSQYISGFIYALSLVGGGEIEITPPISSKSYIYMTVQLINSLGGKVKIKGNKIEVEGSSFRDYIGEIPGDYALSSFYAIASVITGGEVSIENLYPIPEYEGDHSIVEILSKMGVKTEITENRWKVFGSENLKGVTVNVDSFPDLAPSIASIAPFADSETVIEGTKRLRTKESDRVYTITSTLKSFSVKVDANEEQIIIYPSAIKEGHIECPSDHRIAMLAGVLSLVSNGIIDRAECVNKSNPYFWKDLISLGGNINLIK
ncbi:3-phosphoshikimate 1-carboxyvinyltransferase [Stygiolobus caldivivus]|uniref:3-phosphoshikimate 1-carboxyvinyltransferase n=1 Tax=Stygiolobus caldivivus TaxID=2824673 RepID=A0A8D5U4U7_9CREN|nr:3-phosphoshikimate 1-carboxyvinyltransferase [Stygiolobus caldivivus]BCU69461.1 3-phosphoshikimate 1-carboxyvinyltransferase [Stygiolobus caldivivus]